MAKPIRPTDHRSDMSNPMSSSLVIWDGPDIPCLDLCKGDTIEKVVYDLAMHVCNLLEEVKIENIDFTCLLQKNDKTPKDLSELIQLLVDKTCLLLSNGTGGGGVDPSTSCNLNCNITFNDCDNSLVQLPLYDPFAQNDFIRYIISTVCDIYIRLNGIDQSIEDINNQITDILVRITNLEGNQFIFPSTIVNNCLTGGLDLIIDTFPDWINYVKQSIDEICDIIEIIGDVTSGISYILDCSQLNISNVSITSLREFVDVFVNTIFPSLCDKLQNIDTSITDINTQITNINNELEGCGCDCLDYIPVNIVYKPSATSLNNYNIIISPSSSVTINSVMVDYVYYNDCNVNEAVTPTVSGGMTSLEITFPSCGSLSTCNSDPYYSLVVSINYTYLEKTCNYKHELKIKSYSCVCGNVERIFMTEKGNSSVNIMTRI
jgi:hypothetical protein